MDTGFLRWDADLTGWDEFIFLSLAIIGFFMILWWVLKAAYWAYDYLRTRKEFMQAAIRERKDADDSD